MVKKITHSSATNMHMMRDVQLLRHDAYMQLSNNYYKCTTCATVQLMPKSGLLMTNQIREFWYSYD